MINSYEDGISLQSPTHNAIHFVDLRNVAVFIDAIVYGPFYHQIKQILRNPSSDLFVSSRHPLGTCRCVKRAYQDRKQMKPESYPHLRESFRDS